jgi:hypothetical protein
LTEEPPVGEEAQADTNLGVDEILLRRIPRNSWTPDGAGGTRPASGSFKPRSGGEPLSVYREAVMTKLGLAADAVLDGHPGWGFVAFPAGLAIDCGLTVTADPDAADEIKGAAHALMRGRFNDTVLRRLARECDIRQGPA